MDDYKEWVDKEYSTWSVCLEKSMENENDFSNFRSIYQVDRMIGVHSFDGVFLDLVKDLDIPWKELENIDKIGSPKETENINGCEISTTTLRYVYYANRIMSEIDKEKIEIIEIGGGYGGMCAVVNCIFKYKGIKIEKYSIYDLPTVQKFQKFYLSKILSDIDIVEFPDCTNLQSFIYNGEYCISLYALGEFDKITKYNYINNVIAKIKDGFILWNPHADRDEESEKLLFGYHPKAIINKEKPLTSLYNLEIIINRNL